MVVAGNCAGDVKNEGSGLADVVDLAAVGQASGFGWVGALRCGGRSGWAGDGVG